MRTAPDTIDRLVDTFTARLSAGSMEIYEGTRPATPNQGIGTQDRLVSLPIPVDPFFPSENGQAVMRGELAGTVEQSGIASWGLLKDAAGAVVADFLVTDQVGRQPRENDLVMARTDFQRGGPIRITDWILKPMVQS